MFLVVKIRIKGKATKRRRIRGCSGQAINEMEQKIATEAKGAEEGQKLKGMKRTVTTSGIWIDVLTLGQNYFYFYPTGVVGNSLSYARKRRRS